MAPAAGNAAPPAKFLRAEGRRQWHFPADHGQHPRFRLEWWYFTGIVRSASGREFGYQVTFFRQGLSPRAAAGLEARGSAWAVRSLWLGHTALSDLQDRAFHYATRTGRDSLGLCGAAADHLNVWMESWAVQAASGSDEISLTVDAPEFSLALQAHPEKPPTLHGRDGLDRKGAAPGQASWYYSLPRLATQGNLVLGGERFAVTGTTWMDHEFGTNQLGPRQVGWDWFALRLSDGYDLMLYRMRQQDGTADPVSGGTLIDPRGGTTHVQLASGAMPASPRLHAGTPVQAQALRWWQSARSGGRYPVEWELRASDIGATLHIEPLLDAQELTAGRGLPFAYWEGAIRVRGKHRGRQVTGEGYLELTGYAGDVRASFR